MPRTRTEENNTLLIDVLIIAASVFFAGILLETETIAKLLDSLREFEALGTVIVGIFFTSIFTVAPAMVTLGELAQAHGPVSTALWGSIGAVCGDFLIFRFFRDQFSEHLTELIGKQGAYKRLRHLLKTKSFRWLAFLIGGIVIASPLPDEIGISIISFSKMKSSTFIILSFIFNFIGILLIGSVAASVHVLP